MVHACSLDQLEPPQRPALLTIGAFDGVHVGHRALLGQLTAAARARGNQAAVVTFFPHPSVVLRKQEREQPFYINTPAEKADLLAQLGIDITVTHPFDLDVSRRTATEFVEQLQRALDFKEIWCGADFAFGHNREGTVDWLTAQGARRGFAVKVIAHSQAAGEVVSSSRIRRALNAGDVEQAAACLGRPFRLPGVVVEGNKRGRTIGIPTANLKFWEERAYPALGVYACRARVDDQLYHAVTNIGVRPTFGDSQLPTVEAHLLNFDGDLYGKTVTLDFLARLRPEMKFSGVQELVAQIRKDIDNARQYF